MKAKVKKSFVEEMLTESIIELQNEMLREKDGHLDEVMMEIVKAKAKTTFKFLSHIGYDCYNMLRLADLLDIKPLTFEDMLEKEESDEGQKLHSLGETFLMALRCAEDEELCVKALKEVRDEEMMNPVVVMDEFIEENSNKYFDFIMIERCGDVFYKWERR